MSETKFNAYESLYMKLDKREGEIVICKLARAIKKKSRDLASIRYQK